MKTTGKCSWFGGPNDTGVTPSEGLAFIYSVSDQPDLFLPSQPPGTTGLARRLDPDEYYIACRWNYDVTPRSELLNRKALVRSTKTGKEFLAYPGDWGPNSNTGRVADISPGLMSALGIKTDDQVEVIFPAEEEPMQAIVISSGHGKYVRGAVGIIDEVDEARKVVPAVAEALKAKGLTVYTFNDDTSKTQSENLATIVNYHNSKKRDLDVSVHFNCYEQTSTPMGTECLYVTQYDLSAEVASAMSKSGQLKNRGPKKRTDLYFLNNTKEPAILLEVCFVDSQADVDAYKKNFDALCKGIADAIVGDEIAPPGPEPEPPVPPEQEEVVVNITAPPGVKVTVNVND